MDFNIKENINNIDKITSDVRYIAKEHYYLLCLMNGVRSNRDEDILYAVRLFNMLMFVSGIQESKYSILKANLEDFKKKHFCSSNGAEGVIRKFLFKNSYEEGVEGHSEELRIAITFTNKVIAEREKYNARAS